MWVKQRRIVGLVGLALMGWLASHCSSAQCADAVGLAKPAEARKARSTGDQQKQIEDVARRIFAITDVVLDHHIEPATRQEMILTGLRSACAAKKISLPELGRRVSDLKTVDDLAGLLKELWPQLTHGGKPSPTEVEQAIFEGLLRPVPGSPYVLPAKEARVQAQLQANRYIGIGIALASAEKKIDLPQIKHVQPGGPAALGGLRVGDLIEQINKNRIEPGSPLRATVDELRGPEGTEVTIRVRQPDSKESRTMTLTRLPVMFKSVKCDATNGDEDRVVLVNKNPAIAYLKIDSVTASTARELAAWEPRFREAKVQGLILDLRGTGTREGFDNYHSALLLADSLVDGKPLGQLRTRVSVREFSADRECLFRDLPLAVLIDKYTNGPASWVAAVLQDSDPPEQKRRRAVVVGMFGGGDNFIRSAFPLPGGNELIMPNAVWQRPAAGTSPQRKVRLYSWDPGANESYGWSEGHVTATAHREGVLPDAYVSYYAESRDDVQNVEFDQPTDAVPARANLRDPARQLPRSKGASRDASRKFDAFEDVAIIELQQQLELAARKQ
jgi:carboxyl-terminal processing protease